ncbi:MAG: hypothetical protein Q4E19_00155 [Ligilactobacillus salivarius]|nr:hypothetical protein [Ligilactobacillus salivarius]
MHVQTIELVSGANSYVDLYLHDAQISYQVEKKRPIVVVCPGGALCQSC